MKAGRTLLALALQCGALAALLAALSGVAWLDPRSRPRLAVLVDRSHSMPPAATDAALAEVRHAARTAGFADAGVIAFAGTAGAGDKASDTLQPASTDIEAALQAALGLHARTALDALVLISDGHANAGDAGRGLAAARAAGVPVHWLGLGRPAPAARIAEVSAPRRAEAGQPLRLVVPVAAAGAWRLTASARTADGLTLLARAEGRGSSTATLDLDPPPPGPLRVDLALDDATGHAALDRWPDAALVEVSPRAPLLYADGGSGGALARSLQRGGWPLHRVPASRLDSLADALGSYRALLLDDVAVADAGPRFWQALADAVRQQGVGLLVLGGERSFARGGYRDSVLESVLPVLSEPAALQPAVAMVFAVDKSGSMGQASDGVDRLQWAQRAVVDTARGLGERDSLGLVVFDVEPRVLLPLTPAPAARQALERDWPVQARGGTRLAPALEAAIAELERAPAARRILVLASDGFVDAAPLDTWRQRMARARIETIVLGIGADADLGALERATGSATTRLLRVNQPAELPRVMSAGVMRLRARVEQGTIAARQQAALPFVPARLADWPPVAAHPVTRARPEATVSVASASGEPLLAWQPMGQGRVAVVTSGLGPWTPRWLGWQGWPLLAGGLAAWVAGDTPAGAGSLKVLDRSDGLTIDVEAAAGVEAASASSVSIVVARPTGEAQTVAAEWVAPGRLRARLRDTTPGVYSLTVATPQGTQRWLHLRQAALEARSWGIHPRAQAWREAGLVTDWRAAALTRPRGGERSRPLDRTLLALSLLLVLTAVAVDRVPGLDLLQRWRRRRVNASTAPADGPHPAPGSRA